FSKILQCTNLGRINLIQGGGKKEGGTRCPPDAGNCCQALAHPSGVEMEFVSRLCRLPAGRELAGLRAAKPAVRRAHAARTEGGLAAVHRGGGATGNDGAALVSFSRWPGAG